MLVHAVAESMPCQAQGQDGRARPVVADPVDVHSGLGCEEEVAGKPKEVLSVRLTTTGPLPKFAIVVICVSRNAGPTVARA